MAGIAAAAGILMGIALNAKARAHTTASQSLALAKSLREQIEQDPNGPARGVSVRLHKELLDREHYAIQNYLSETTPRRLNIIDILAWFIIIILLGLIVWVTKGVPAEWQSARTALFWAVLIAGVVFLVTGLVSSFKKISVEDALEAKRDTLFEESPSEGVTGAPQSKGIRYAVIALGVSACVGLFGLSRWRRAR